MNYFRYSILLLLFSVVYQLPAQNSLIIKDLQAGPGDAAKIIIDLENKDTVSGFQFKIKLPADLVVKEKEAKLLGRHTDHVVYPKNSGNGEYLFLCFSGTNDNFTGQTGALLEIPVELPLTYTPGQTYAMTFTEAIVSSSSGQDIGSNHKNGTVNITEGKNPDLEVSAVTFSQTDILPNAKFAVKWDVHNIGKAAATGGWKEQISLVSQTNGKKYIIGYASYHDPLKENESIARTADVDVPGIIGFDGNVKIEVTLITNTAVKEPSTAKGNNTTLSANIANLLKRLILSIDKQEVIENSPDKIRLNIARSGDLNSDETFSITSDMAGRIDFPSTLTINKNESAIFIYIKPLNNTTYEGDKKVNLAVKGNSYTDEQVSFNLLDDEKVILSLSYPPDYTSTIGSKILFTLTASFPKNTDQVIDISSNNAKRLQLPAQVTLKANTQTLTFEGIILDTKEIEKAEVATVIVKAEGYITADKDLKLNSINIPKFTLSIKPNKVSEGDGIKACYANLKRSDQLDKQAVFQITASKSDQLILPSEVVFEKGESEKIFNIGTVNNSQVEGERIIRVTSQIKFQGCNCTDDSDSTSIVKQDVTILDNDGLALTVVVSPSTVKAGATNNKLTISRNTDNATILQNPVTVNLTADLPSVADVPATATIPSGKKEVIVTFNTKIDSALKGDQTIRIQAAAQGYSTGFGWLLVSDQNKADAEVVNIFADSTTEAGKKANVKTSISNHGNKLYPAGYKIEYYLSKTTSIKDVKPFATSIINKAIHVGNTYEYSEEVQLPYISGNLYLIATINSDKSIDELTFDNNQNQILINVLPAFDVTVKLDKKIVKSGEVVKATGEAKAAGGKTVPNAAVILTFKNQEFSKEYTVKTDGTGSFVFEYKPLDNENGIYTVSAAFPGAIVTPQETFQLLGFEVLNKPQFIKWEPLVNLPLGQEFVLKNKTNTKLTGVKIQLPADASFTIDQTPIDINAGATVTLPFKVVSTIASKELKYDELKMSIVSTEGAVYKEVVYYYSKNQEAKLEATPISINTTMPKDKSRLYEISLKNIGAVDAENVEILLPAVDWVKLSSPKVIDKIKSNEEAKVIFELKPTVKEQVNVPINGTFVIKQKTGEGLIVPFNITTVSESTGKLIIDATDEYTYNTASAPHLKGAKVIVKQPYTGVVVAEGLTNDFGLFEVPTIPEGWYTIAVSLDKHNPYQNNILVDPGKDTKITTFLSYQAISYSWEVKPTEVKDEYDVKLNVQFETNVPKPVIIMEVDNPKLDLKIGESRLSYITVTNLGLIAANKVNISAGETDGYSIKPLITSLDVINAKSSVIIPVLIKNDSSANKGFLNRSGSGGCTVPINVRAVYLCDTEKEMFAFTVYAKVSCSGGGTIPIHVDIGPNYPGGGGKCIICDNTPYSGGGSFTPLLDLCDPCDREIIKTVFICLKYKKVACFLDLIANTNTGSAIKDCIKPPTCIKSITKTIRECVSSGKKSPEQNSRAKGKWDFIQEDFSKIDEAHVAHENKMSEYLKNPTLESNDSIMPIFLEQVATHLDDEKPFTAAEVVSVKNNLAGVMIISKSYIDSFVTRWNKTLEAWKLNILSPNAQYPDIVDKIKINAFNAVKEELKPYAFKRGFVSVQEMYEKDVQAMEDYQKEKSKDQASSCAKVTLEFPQKLTMTRQAFEGTLKINNSSSKLIKDINLDIVIKNANGENKTYLFQVNKEAFISGTGEVSPGSNGSGKAIFIPTKEAAPDAKQSYSFGGTLSYYDPEIKERVNIVLNPVTLEVNPSPDLVLHYFMQRDILGDDALTEAIVEPSFPAELSLMINNEGYGEAKNVNVESTQPKIIDNEKGLLIDFKMIGSNFNNEPKQLGLLNVDFGNIAPKKSAIGRWFFTSSLLGHFVKYDVKVTHKSSYGNANLSLIKAAYVHELIKSVRSYDTTSDAIDDFLVNDLADAYDTPDHIYLSNGTSEDVSKAQTVEALNQVSPANLTAKVKITPATSGWNYGNITDPGSDQYKLTKIVRDRDQLEIPFANFWQTYVTLKDGLNPKYENKLHVLDKISQIETYTLYFNPIDGNIPSVESFVDAPEKNNSKPVEVVKVKFNKEIDVNTFTTANIELISQGSKLPVDSILIGKIDATTYAINIAAVTKTSGYYELLVKTLGIKDLVGNEGKDGKKIDWIQFINELGILKFESDQVKKNSINSLKIVFNKPIRTEEFTVDKITINNTAAASLSIQKTDDYNYTISGISAFNKLNGDYTIGVDASKITAVDGTKGLTVQTYNWKVDNTLPKIVSFQAVSQAALNNQNITEIDVELNRKIASKLETSSIQFTKDGQKLNIPVTINQIDDLHYKLTGLGSYTLTNGKYKVTIDQSALKDENNNFGEGIAETSWTVKLVALTAIADVKVSPDKGSSGTDNITSGNAVQLVYKTLQDSLTVEVYQLQATNEVLVDKQFRAQEGEFYVPLNGITGAQKFKLIATDANGNSSNAVLFSAYLDVTELQAQIKPVDEIFNDCSDFDHINVHFSDDIDEQTFTVNTLTLKSLGVVIPKDKLTIKKISDQEYIIDSVKNPNNAAITLEIDKTKITKKLSGLNGTATESKEIGNPTKYITTISGEKKPFVNGIYNYTASDANLNKYDWIATNGEIISSSANTVQVKWKQTGPQSLIVRYLTPFNCSLTATQEVVVGDSNTAPSVTITKPVNGATILEGTSVSITATASDADGTVAAVEFLIDGNTLGTDSIAPYAATYKAFPGFHSIVVRATDNKGASASDTISINVNVADNAAPVVIIQSPVNGANLTAGDTISITASASDIDGTVSSVEFFVDDISVGIDITDPYKASYIAVTGSRTIIAKATDNKGAQSADTISVHVKNPVNSAPTVYITSPDDGDSFFVGDQLSIAATAKDQDGFITAVEFFVDGHSVGLDSIAPYQASYIALAGNHAIAVVATDNKGASDYDTISIQVINSSHQAYTIQTISGVCTDPSFCIPVLAVDSVKNVIGYDLVLNYNPVKVQATGRVSFNNALIDSAYISYAVNNDAVNGKINISAYLNSSAPANSGFNGIGQLLCVEFAKKPALHANDAASFDIPFLQESYTIGVATKQVHAGTYINTKSAIYTGSLKFWTNNSPIPYNPGNTGQYLITNIYGTNAACGNKSATAVQPDTAGVFHYNTLNGTHIGIERDIAPSTAVQPVINGFDASLGHKVLLDDPSFKPSIFQVIALDVNADGIISAGDISQLNQRSVKTIPEFKQKWNYDNNGNSNGQPSKDWLFVDSTLLSGPAYKVSSTYPLNDGVGYSKTKVPVVPFCLAVPVSDSTSCPVYASSVYKGILLGDINGNYDAIPADGHLKKEIAIDGTIYIHLDEVKVGSGYVDIPVSMVSSAAITSLDFAIQFNEDALRFDKIISSASYLTDAMANYAKDDKTLRFTSNSLQHYETEKAIVTVRFHTLTSIINERDLFGFSGYLNGDNARTEIKGSIITGVSNSDNNHTVIAYPNPANDVIHVIVSEKAVVELTDLQNRQVIVPLLIQGNQKQDLHTENIAPGMYLLKVYNENFISTQRIIIENIR